MTDDATASTEAVTDNRTRQRFELAVGGEIVFADYRRQPGRLIITHVEAPPVLRGTGAAGRLMEGVLQMVREEGVMVIPLCGYARAYLQRRPEHRDLVG